MKWIGQLWRGEIALSKAFWKFGILVPIILAIVAGLLYAAVMIVMSFFLFAGPGAPAGLQGGVVFVLVTMAVLIFAYQVLACVGVWRSAARYSGKPIYPILARGVLALYLVLALGNVAVAVRVLVFT